MTDTPYMTDSTAYTFGLDTFGDRNADASGTPGPAAPSASPADLSNGWPDAKRAWNATWPLR